MLVPVLLFDLVFGLCISESLVFCSFVYIALITSVKEFSTTTSLIRSY